MDNDYLAKCAQLDLLIELKRICEKNLINYFLVGGTLIGAVRHGGFIPWDDDIDVGMLRDDYDKFVRICKNDIKEDYFLHDWNVDQNSPLPFCKLKIKNTHYREKISDSSEMSDEIFIDIFPYDNAPYNIIRQIKQNIINIVIKKVLLIKNGFAIDENENGGVIKTIFYLPFRLASHMFSNEFLKKKYEENAQKYNNSNSDKVISLSGSYSYKKELKERILVNQYSFVKFEGIQFQVPKDPDLFLRQVYGDYMRLPPVEKRVSRQCILNIDLGNYEIKNRIEVGKKL